MKENTTISNNKRIAKNTLLLYFRTIITMLITLYASRIVLNTLGVVDFGIYNVVGGVVMMFSFLNNAMATSTQRFLSFEIGIEKYFQLKNTFSMLLNIHITIAFVIFLLAETVGLWFLNTKLNIPVERIDAARWMYQFSILSFMVIVIQVPYNASIIAHEKMNMFAYVSILEVSLKLLIVFILSWISFDKLKLYAFLSFLATFFIAIIYRIYCKRKFDECSYQFNWDRNLFKILLNYSGWNLFGGISVVAANHGINILLNIFFGPVINTARSIAYQVGSAIHVFVGNFQTAVNPQIVKSYARENQQYMMMLIYQSAKYSFFLLFLLSFPVLLETKFILMLWLKTVPDYAVLFCRLVLINIWIDCLSGPLVIAVQATGKIKWYQIIVGTLIVINLPISYIALKMTLMPEITLYISIIISSLALFARIIVLRKLTEISIREYIRQVLCPAGIVIIIPIILSFGLLSLLNANITRLIIVSIFAITTSACSIYLIGLKYSEQQFVMNKLKLFLKLR
jgi:O-antigen/teichoic acid export membrane protein